MNVLLTVEFVLLEGPLGPIDVTIIGLKTAGAHPWLYAMSKLGLAQGG